MVPLNPLWKISLEDREANHHNFYFTEAHVLYSHNFSTGKVTLYEEKRGKCGFVMEILTCDIPLCPGGLAHQLLSSNGSQFLLCGSRNLPIFHIVDLRALKFRSIELPFRLRGFVCASDGQTVAIARQADVGFDVRKSFLDNSVLNIHFYCKENQAEHLSCMFWPFVTALSDHSHRVILLWTSITQTLGTA